MLNTTASPVTLSLVRLTLGEAMRQETLRMLTSLTLDDAADFRTAFTTRKTFINAENYTEKTLMWQTLIHITFLLSALAIALTDRLMPTGKRGEH